VRHSGCKCKSGREPEAAIRLPAPSGARAKRESQGPEARRRLRQKDQKPQRGLRRQAAPREASLTWRASPRQAQSEAEAKATDVAAGA